MTEEEGIVKVFETKDAILDLDTLINIKDTREPVAIIIPCRNSGKSLKLTIESILQNIQYPYKIYLIEGHSTDGTAELCNKFVMNYPDKIEVHHIEAEGTTCAINYGIRCAGDLDVLLTQDDVIFHKFLGRDILYDFVEISKINNCGIVTVKNGGGKSGEMYLDGFEWVGTWCMFISRKTINKIGMLDEMYNPGDGDDIDYTYTVFAAGLKVYNTDLFVEHHRKFSIKQHEHENQKIKKRNSLYFKTKWGLDIPPRTIQMGIPDIMRNFDKFSLLDEGYKMDQIGFVHHDREVFETIIGVCKRFNHDDIMIDVGAGNGDTSVWLNKGTCFAFEPSGRQYAHLLTNIGLNPGCNVVPIMSAVYSKPIYYESIPGTHYGLDKIIETEDTTKSQAIVLDEMFKNVHNIRLIKIDAEGADLEILKGALNIIEKNRPVVIVEVDHVDNEAVEKILLDLNYDLSQSRGINCIGVPLK